MLKRVKEWRCDFGVHCWVVSNTACTNILLTLLILLAGRRLHDRLSPRRFCHHILMLRCPTLIWWICCLAILRRR
jgi:hypothetical protein